MNNKALFLDRDGVLNYVIFRGSSPKPIAPWSFEEFNIIPGLEHTLNKIRNKKYYLFVVTNQPDISKGILSINSLNKMHKLLYSKFPITEIKYCPHEDKDNCNCRKPKPGMIFELSEKYNIDLKKSYLVGDNFKDIQAGKAAGLTTILIKKFYNKLFDADFKISKIVELLEIIK